MAKRPPNIPISCDWRQGAAKSKKTSAAPKPALYKSRPGCIWGRVKTDRYKKDDGSWSAVLRRTIIGGLKGERTKFHLRYFEIAPKGHTTLETHKHEHVVICVRGQGACRAGNKRFKMELLDVAYVPPMAAHQLSNPHKEPFGFFCIVDSKRDRPTPASEKSRKNRADKL